MVATTAADEPEHEVAGEGGHDHHRPGGYEARGNGVDELVLGQPAVVLDQAGVQERNDGQGGAARERRGLEDEPARRTPRRSRAGPLEPLTAASSASSDTLANPRPPLRLLGSPPP